MNDCCVYCGNLKEVDECPTCDTVRLVEGKERKEFRFIPLKRQLRHLFADPELAAKLRRDRIDWPQPQPGHVEVSLLCDQLATNHHVRDRVSSVHLPGTSTWRVMSPSQQSRGI